MQTQLSADETIIKSWDYASEKKRGEKNRANLTVTNKRIIASTANSHEYKYTEIPLKAVQTIDGYRDKKFNIFSIIIIVFGLVSAIVAIASFKSNIGIAVALLLLGIVLLILGIVNLCKGSFYLIIGIGNDALCLNANSGDEFKHKKRRQPRVKVKIDYNMVDEIFASLGAIVYDNN